MRWYEIMNEDESPWATGELTNAPKKVGYNPVVTDHQLSSKQVNRYLLNNKGLLNTIKGIISGKKITQKINALDEFLSRLSLDKGATVYHGTNSYNPGEAAQKNGGTLTIPAYVSTTTDRNVAYNFAGGHKGGGHILAFDIPAGFSALDIGGVEHEILLPRGLTLRVNPTPKVLPNNITIWSCEVSQASGG